ncbi:DUF1842 domain-containing protein [Crenobacter cavernae]|uniref:DUF1842 domain-containing protein n=1 Tax=Crenobacter cavernae TaxID=2290923 RepID=A0ABY0FCS5_9NEIS|nr:DUF1842 domain-containing protein [Crenobacter cavernae]RXZ43940.1 DUF1842 domain-containing protein [Crenobacter cavernae]
MAGLFIVSYQIGDAKPGAPLFHVNLSVNTVDRTVGGSGQVTQATNPPLNIHVSALHGEYNYLTVQPNESHILVVAKGEVAHNFPPPAIGTILLPVELRLVLSHDWKTGTAYYKYPNVEGKQVTVENAPVKAVTPELLTP